MSLDRLLSSSDVRSLAHELQGYGRGGDTMLAHITPEEARLLKRRGGSGTINPVTGLLEFADEGDWAGSAGWDGNGNGPGDTGNEGAPDLGSVGPFAGAGPGPSLGDESLQDYYESQMAGPMGPGRGGAWTSSGEGLGTFGDMWRGEMGFGQWALGRAMAAIDYDIPAAIGNLGFNLAFPGLGLANSLANGLFGVSVGGLGSQALANLGPTTTTGPSSPTQTVAADPSNPTSTIGSPPDPTFGVYGSDPVLAALANDPASSAPISAAPGSYNFVRYPG